MFRSSITIWLAVGLGPSIAWSQFSGEFYANPVVAYVYVSDNPANSGENQVEAFAARADGRLYAVSGSPYRFDVTSLSADGRHLFALSRTAAEIETYSIAPDGALALERSTGYAQHNPGHCGRAAWLFPDRTGADLYAMEFHGDCANNTYQSFALQNPSGNLHYLGAANGGAGSFSGVYLPAAFLGNNLYAYEVTSNSCMYYSVRGFRRESSGLLAAASLGATLPEPPPGYRIYIPTFAATDPDNHVAITLIAANPPGCSDPKVQIASFTAAANGELTTTNTHANLPDTSIVDVTDLKISPAGNLLAVGGQQGLQLFHFNGAKPVTPYTGMVTVDPVTQMFWDSGDRLYVISRSAGRLHVFTVNETSVMEAPGSPYPIHSPQFLAVEPQAR